MGYLILYITEDLVYSVPNDFWLAYVIRIVKTLFFSFLLTVFFNIDYTVLIMAVTVLFADFKFYIDLQHYLDIVEEEQ